MRGSGSGQPFPRACAGRGVQERPKCGALLLSFPCRRVPSGRRTGLSVRAGCREPGRASQVGAGRRGAELPQGHCCRVLTVPVREDRRRAFTCLFRENCLGAVQKARPTLFYLLHFLADLSSLRVHRAMLSECLHVAKSVAKCTSRAHFIHSSTWNLSES